MKGLTRSLYRAARASNNVDALARGRTRRAVNLGIGRGLARSGAWSRLWGGRR